MSIIYLQIFMVLCTFLIYLFVLFINPLSRNIVELRTVLNYLSAAELQNLPAGRQVFVEKNRK